MHLRERIAATGAMLALLGSPALADVHICGAPSVTDLAAAQQRAATGDPKAICNLAGAYLDGLVVAVDASRAQGLYQQAAQKGKGCGLNGLGNLYFTGALGPPDYTSALGYYRRAFVVGYAISASNIAQVYLNQTPPDYNDANHWYAMSVKLGCAEGYHGLGEAYEFGYGEPIDGKHAEKYLLAAAGAGVGEAKVDLGTLYFQVPGMRDFRKALKWYREASDFDLADYALGRMYYWGYGVPKDRHQAFSWLMLAAQKAYGDAEVAVGRMLQGGDGTNQDQAQSVKWFQQAASQGVPSAFFFLGGAYASGYGVAADPAMAIESYKAGAARGDFLSMTTLGNLYRYGWTGLPADPVTAYAYLTVTGRANPPDAEAAKAVKSQLSAAQLALAQSIIDQLPSVQFTLAPPEP